MSRSDCDNNQTSADFVDEHLVRGDLGNSCGDSLHEHHRLYCHDAQDIQQPPLQGLVLLVGILKYPNFNFWTASKLLL